MGKSLIATAIGLALIGCGGSDSETETTTEVTSLKLGLSGHIVGFDNPNGADITISVGGEQHTFVADENGNYSAQLELNSNQSDDVVNIQAQFAANNIAKLSSYLNTVSALIELAGSDGILTADELQGVNLSAITTAKAALLEDTDPNSMIESLEELNNALNSYDSALLLHLSALIEIVIDQSADFSLPDGSSNTYDLVANLDAAIAFMQSIYVSAPDLINEVIASITSDSSLTSNQNIASDSYIFSNPLSGHSLGVITFNQDGTGHWTADGGRNEITWTDESGVKHITFPNNDFSSTGLEYVESLGREVSYQMSRKSTTIKLIDDGHASATFFITYTYEKVYATDANLDPVDVVYTANDQVTKVSTGLAPISDFVEIGTTIHLPLPTTLTGSPNAFEDTSETKTNTVEAVFSGNFSDGGEVTLYHHKINKDTSIYKEAESYIWTTDGSTITIDTDDAYLTYSLIAAHSNSNIRNISVTRELKSSGKFETANEFGLIDKNYDWSNNVAGIYNWKYTKLMPYIYHFWIELEDDGTGYTYWAIDRDQNGEVDGENEIGIMPSRWMINDNGNLLVRRYMDPNNTSIYCLPDTFSPSIDGDCVIYHEREWDVQHAVSTDEGEALHMLHTHKMHTDWMQGYYSGIPTDELKGLYWSTHDIRAWIRVDSAPYVIPETKKSAALRSLSPVRTSSPRGYSDIELELESQ